MQTHPFDAALALSAQGENRYAGQTSRAYAGFVGPFGGVTAALALRAVLLHPRRKGVPISMTLNFAAALADGAFVVEARPARTNRSTQHWTIEIVQSGVTMILGTAFFGLRRDAWSRDEIAVPRVPAPDTVDRSDGSGREPVVQRYEMRFVDGEYPTTWDAQDGGSSRTCLWCRDDPPRPLDYCSLAALSDVFFPRIWRRRPKKVPVGTVTMTLHFNAGLDSLRNAGDNYLLGQIQSHAFRNGYSDQTAHLWSESGELLLTAHQMAYYRE